MIYQPETGNSLFEAYTGAIQELSAIYTPSIYKRLADMHLNGHEAVVMIGDAMQQTFEDYGLEAADGRVAFTAPIKTERGKWQAHQSVLTLNGKDPEVLAVVDIASYLYGFPYREMPTAIGATPVIEQVFSELYTSRIGDQVDTQFFPRGLIG